MQGTNNFKYLRDFWVLAYFMGFREQKKKMQIFHQNRLSVDKNNKRVYSNEYLILIISCRKS